MYARTLGNRPCRVAAFFRSTRNRSGLIPRFEHFVPPFVVRGTDSDSLPRSTFLLARRFASLAPTIFFFLKREKEEKLRRELDDIQLRDYLPATGEPKRGTCWLNT